MKSVLILAVFLAIVVENQGAPEPAPQQIGTSGFNSGGSKPGSCYRPGFGGGRRKRSEDFTAEDEVIHEIQKRAIETNGFHGSNPWRPPRPTTRPPSYFPRCSRDSQCAGNKKCCSGQCQTPSFVG